MLIADGTSFDWAEFAFLTVVIFLALAAVVMLFRWLRGSG